MTSAEEFNCILCKEKFDNKDELQIHFRKHGDPKFNESIKTKNRTQNETPLSNEKSNDASEMVNCDVCDEVFATISKAITHKHKVHPEHDAKYFCPWCGKVFTMKHLYNKHLHTNHDATEEIPENKDCQFHCDSCTVYFFIPAAMVYHNKFFHRQDTDLPIIGHSKKQKLFNQELLPVYYCSFCGEEYINKVNLHKHICDDHGDENQRPTDVLRCPLCEAIFYHLDAYELHLTFHSSEDLYSETNEMNEKELSEFSLETVPPVMERIEDLNNLPDVQSGVDAIGIESFLQMAMDEPNDTDQRPEKAKSKKHKKHKKSKKPAITLDEFLSMNQDVFGEDLDFHGIEEVPTKVITSQLKVKKPLIAKKSAKLVSSADLKKLQKQGIVVKVQSSNKPSLSQLKSVGQPVKINQQVKNLPTQTKTKAISASNEVLSKLLNQSSNQLKIVKKPIQEMANNVESVATELKTGNFKDKTVTETALESMETNGDEREENFDTQKINVTPSCSPQRSPINNQDNTDLIAEDTLPSVTNESDRTGSKQHVNTNNEFNMNPNESNYDHTKQIKSYQIRSINVNQNVSPGNKMNDTLKNIGNQITIKPITQPAIKSPGKGQPDRPAVPEVNESAVEEDKISCNIDEDTEQNNENKKNHSLNTLKNLNSAITIKPLKNTSVPVPNKNNTTSNEKTDKIFKQGTLNNQEISPMQQFKLENTAETVINKSDSLKEKVVHITPSSQVLKNIGKNITVKSMSPTVKHSNEDATSDENDDTDFENHEDESSLESRKNNSIPCSVSDKLKILSPGQKFNSDITIKSSCQSPCTNKRVVTNIEKKVSDNGTCAKDEVLNTSSNLLKHLKNITAKPVSKSIHQETTANFITKTITVTAENDAIKKTMLTKEISEDIEIFNIDDSDDELEQAKPDKTVTTPIKLESAKPERNSHAPLNVIKNISKNVTVKSSNNQAILKEIINKKDESNAHPFSDDDEMHDDAEYNSNDNFEDHTTFHVNKSLSNQKGEYIIKNKDESLKRVLKHLGKHITVKSRNASPNPSIKSLDYTLQDFNQGTTANDTDSDEDSYNGKVKITEITNERDDDHTNNCDNTGIVTHTPEDSNSGDEQREIEKNNEYETQNLKIRLSQNRKPNEGLLKNISKSITIKSLSENIVDNEDKKCETAVPENELIANRTKLCKELLIKPIKQNNTEIPNDSEKAKTLNFSHSKQAEGTSSASPSVHPKLGKPGVVNTVNKEVKVKTFQSETVIEEITTTVTKTIRRVNQTVNHQVFNTNQISPTPRMIKPKTGPRMASIQTNNLQGVTVRQSTPGVVRPKIRQAVPFRPAAGTIVRPSNQLVPMRPSVTQIRPNSSPRMPIKNMPCQQRPVGRPIKISPNVVNQTLKRSGNNDELPGHFSCFKKPKESLIPGNETGVDTSSDFQYASSSQMSKFSSTKRSAKGNTVMTTTQMKSESSSQQQQINRLGSMSGLKIAKTSHVSQVEKTEINASKRTTMAAIEKLQKQGLLVKKPRVEEDSDLPNYGGEDNEQFDDDDYDE